LNPQAVDNGMKRLVVYVVKGLHDVRNYPVECRQFGGPSNTDMIACCNVNTTD
jgi:hypothetical protein